MPRIPSKMPRSSFVQLFKSFSVPPELPLSELASQSCGPRKSTQNIRTHTRTKCKCLLVRSNKDPRRCPECPRRCPGRLLFNFSRASRRHRNRLYQSSHPNVAARGKVHKISGHTRGRNLNVSWFGLTRTPEDAPNTPEDAPAVFCSTFRELPGATGIASIGARIQKLRLTQKKYIKYQDTHADEM